MLLSFLSLLPLVLLKNLPLPHARSLKPPAESCQISASYFFDSGPCSAQLGGGGGSRGMLSSWVKDDTKRLSCHQLYPGQTVVHFKYAEHKALNLFRLSWCSVGGGGGSGAPV